MKLTRELIMKILRYGGIVYRLYYHPYLTSAGLLAKLIAREEGLIFDQ